jgi:hypothetical protein
LTDALSVLTRPLTALAAVVAAAVAASVAATDAVAVAATAAVVVSSCPNDPVFSVLILLPGYDGGRG